MGVKKLLKRARVGKKKSPSSPVNHKRIVQNEGIKRPKQKKTLLIAQEIKFARILASNDKKARAKMLKNLKSWITVRSKSSFAFTETDFMRLWKGLFYCMWMSDKPLVQEELAESISNLIHCFETVETAGLYAKCTLKTLTTEWFGIDQYRIDKFQMLVRRILRQIFFMCKKRNWSEEWMKEVCKVVKETLLDPKGSLGLKFHIVDIYMEELAKVSEGDIPENVVTELLRPFAIYLATMEDERPIRHVMKNIFRYLIFQSDVGIEYMERFEAWSKAGYPTGSIDAMKKVEISDEELEEDDTDEEIEPEKRPVKAMDPRAGRVDVELPQVPFDPQEISELIQQYKFHPSSTTKTRRKINKLIKEFSELAKGEMPLGVKKVELPQKKSAETNPKKAAKNLIEFENELFADSAKNLRKKKKRKENGIVDNKSKKPKLDEQTDESNLPEETAKISKTKLKKSKKSMENQEEQKDSPSPKKKSLQKEFKVKTKTKKLKNMKNALNKELLDGIDDFAEFKKSSVSIKTKKSKFNLNNSWNVSTSDTSVPSTPTTTPVKVKKSPKTPATVPRVEKVKVSEKKSPPNENIKVDKIPWLLPVVTKLEQEKIKFKTPTKALLTTPEVTSSGKKRVKIVLQKNTAQHTSEYFRQLRLSPQIPYDANKKPPAGVLKPSPLASPVNPFYKKL